MKALKKSDNNLVQFIRYLIVGGGAAAVQWGILLVLKELMDQDANLGNLVGFMGGLVFNFVISRLWVFGAPTVRSRKAEFTVFALIGLVGLGINQGMIWLFDKTLADRTLFGGLIPPDKYYLAGQLLATGLAFFWNFFARKLILYRQLPRHGRGIQS